MRSLSARLLVAVSILLLIALSFTAIILDRIFRNAALEATAERLNAQVILLMSSADIDAQGQLQMPDLLPEARFMTPDSGLLGFVGNSSGMLWKSDSAVGLNENSARPVLEVDQENTQNKPLKKTSIEQKEYFRSSMSVEWEVSNDEGNDGVKDNFQTFIFSAAESTRPFNAQLNEFRVRLFSWFAFLIVCLLISQAALMRWVLKPLRKIANEVSEIDQGQRNTLSQDYPSELLGLTSNTNALIKAERSRLERYQNTLGNLAHSLKTPLAVIQTATEQQQTDNSVIQKQVKSMNDIVSYQLKRAATVGQATLGREPIKVAPVLNDILGALKKVYFDKQITFNHRVGSNVLFYGARGDLTEVLGNLLDNASKWCEHQVSISINYIDAEKVRSGLIITVEDDGAGINESERARILKRGQRADENTPGHGIGLAIIGEVVHSYQGDIKVEKSSFGGARFIITLPNALDI